MNKSNTQPITELGDLPLLEDFIFTSHGGVRDGSGRRRTGRRNITIYVKSAILDALGPHPGTALRLFIEAEFEKNHLGRRTQETSAKSQVKS